MSVGTSVCRARRVPDDCIKLCTTPPHPLPWYLFHLLLLGCFLHSNPDVVGTCLSCGVVLVNLREVIGNPKVMISWEEM